MDCEFCKKTFSSKSNLTAHQKSAKFCLNLQGSNNEVEKNFTCEYCQKTLTQQKSLDVHIVSCKEKKKTLERTKDIEQALTIKRLEMEIIKLKRSEKEKLREKNEYITKLEAKLEKFENAVVTNMAATTSKLYDEDDDQYEDDVPIPLGKKLDSIVIEEINEEVEYSNITLNNIVITSRPIDHYVNATQLCQAGGKKFSHWFSLETTKELMNELSADAGIPASGLVETKRGGNDKSKQGSWIHPDLSIQLAQWISPKFAIQVSKWIRKLFSDGSIEIDLSLMREKETEMREKDNRIKKLESVCLSKQRRVVYAERNVIYMLTTDDHLKRRTYIIGKATNLTNRLSTYNKTCDHTVVHYRECKNTDDMDTIETMVLNKLRSYREQANRDRFILPDDKDESFFTETIDECIGFLAKN
jgi:hypothetical protein